MSARSAGRIMRDPAEKGRWGAHRRAHMSPWANVAQPEGALGRPIESISTAESKIIAPPSAC